MYAIKKYTEPTDLTVGMRVDVKTVIKETWQSEHWLKNAIVVKIDDNNVKITVDDQTEKSQFCAFPWGGLFSFYSFETKPTK